MSDTTEVLGKILAWAECGLTEGEYLKTAELLKKAHAVAEVKRNTCPINVILTFYKSSGDVVSTVDIKEAKHASPRPIYGAPIDYFTWIGTYKVHALEARSLPETRIVQFLESRLGLARGDKYTVSIDGVIYRDMTIREHLELDKHDTELSCELYCEENGLNHHCEYGTVNEVYRSVLYDVFHMCRGLTNLPTLQ